MNFHFFLVQLPIMMQRLLQLAWTINRISRIFGVGGLIDHATGEINSTLIAPALFLHVKKFCFTLAPSVELSEDETTAVLRVGVEYEIEISRFSISPALFFDTERDENPSLVYGVSFGFEF